MQLTSQPGAPQGGRRIYIYIYIVRSHFGSSLTGPGAGRAGVIYRHWLRLATGFQKKVSLSHFVWSHKSDRIIICESPCRRLTTSFTLSLWPSCKWICRAVPLAKGSMTMGAVGTKEILAFSPTLRLVAKVHRCRRCPPRLHTLCLHNPILERAYLHILCLHNPRVRLH